MSASTTRPALILALALPLAILGGTVHAQFGQQQNRPPFPRPQANPPRVEVVEVHTCRKCGHRWETKFGANPQSCPRCGQSFSLLAPNNGGGASSSVAGTAGAIAVLVLIGLGLAGLVGVAVLVLIIWLIVRAASGSRSSDRDPPRRRRRRLAADMD